MSAPSAVAQPNGDFGINATYMVIMFYQISQGIPNGMTGVTWMSVSSCWASSEVVADHEAYLQVRRYLK